MSQQKDPRFPNGYCWVRLKPKHPKLGKKQGIYLERLHALGRVWVGGDGIQVIPQWYQVDTTLVPYLRYFKQRQEQPNSLDAFDFVFDDEVRMQMDTAEAYNRSAAMGMAAPPQMPFQQHPGMYPGAVPMAPHQAYVGGTSSSSSASSRASRKACVTPEF